MKGRREWLIAVRVGSYDFLLINNVLPSPAPMFSQINTE